MLQTANHCPLLEELTIKIQRSLGDAVEVAIYKAIGALLRLERLFLILDAANRQLGSVDNGEEYNSSNEEETERATPNDPSFNELDRQILRIYTSNGRLIRRGHVRYSFINSVVDAKLATSIFHAISSGKRPGARALETMMLFPIGAIKFCEPDNYGQPP
jgi:hypothetical protein